MIHLTHHKLNVTISQGFTMPLALYSFTLEMHLTPEGTLGDGEFLNTQDVWKLFPERGYVPAGADDNEGPSGGTE